MENFANISSRQKVSVSIEELNRNDVVYLSSKDDATPYQVLDIGAPFILIENMKTHFANLYRPVLIYKEI